MYRQPKFGGAGFHGTRVQRPAAARRSVGLREYRANPVRRLQRIECRYSELRRAGEAQP
jgi:hypothetical protein